MRRFAIVVAIASLALACKAKEAPIAKVKEIAPDSSATKSAEANEGDGGDDDSAGSGVGGLLSGLAKSKKRGPWEEAKKSKGADKATPHHAIVDLDGEVVELEAASLLGGMKDKLELRDVTTRLEQLAADPNTKSILLRVGDLEISMAVAEELRATLNAVRAKKKPVHCYTPNAANATYLVLTACDDVTLAPTGGIVLSGPAATPIYLKGLLDKLHVETDFLHIGAYKGAAEPLQRTDPSPEMKEALGAILDGEYARLVDGVALGRHLPRDQVVAAIDQAIFTDTQAKDAKLVDAVSEMHDWRDEATHGEPWLTVELSSDKGMDMSGLLDLLGGESPKQKRVTGPHVALLYAVGDVEDGDGDTASARTKIQPGPLGAALRIAADDPDVKAIVLRVDSPGGSAEASELIWHAVDYAKSKKPLVVSMGSVAASGGYYISCDATKIFALPDTLTGSIGVVGGKIVLGPALENIGVTTFELTRGKRGGIYSALRKWTPEERKTIEDTMRAVYDVFKGRVAAGRGKTPADIEPIAQGRVWLGADAKDRGLVDELGTLDDAIAFARGAGKLPEDAPVDVYPPPPTIFDLLSSFQLGVRVRAELPSILVEAAAALGPRGGELLARTWTQLVAFRTGAVQAVLLFPVLL
jgi:protease-4